MIRSRLAATGAASLLALALAACGGSGSTTAASGSAPAASAPPASAPAGSAPAASGGASPSSGGGSAAVCAPTSGSGQIQATAKGFAFDPATVAVPVGQSVTWTNGDSAAHSIVLDGGQCQSEPFAGGATTTLKFDVAGSYPFHCGIHPTMKGTIQVTG